MNAAKYFFRLEAEFLETRIRALIIEHSHCKSEAKLRRIEEQLKRMEAKLVNCHVYLNTGDISIFQQKSPWA